MTPTPQKLVTVIIEHVIRDLVLRKLLELGATGFSYQSTMGQGSRGIRKDVISGDNLRIECVCDAVTAERILREISAAFFHNYAGIAWSSDIMAVDVRASKQA